MKGTIIFVERINGSKREIEYEELNQLKKDILWMFDENGSELHNSYVPHYSFTLPYWEYATLNGDFYDKEKQFYREGALIVILGMVAEYVDIEGGSQLVFGDNKIEDIINYISKLEPLDEEQNSLKELVLLGLSIASSITKEDIEKNELFKHPQLKQFYSRLSGISKTFIEPYYKSKLTEFN